MAEMFTGRPPLKTKEWFLNVLAVHFETEKICSRGAILFGLCVLQTNEEGKNKSQFCLDQPCFGIPVQLF